MRADSCLVARDCSPHTPLTSCFVHHATVAQLAVGAAGELEEVHVMRPSGTAIDYDAPTEVADNSVRPDFCMAEALDHRREEMQTKWNSMIVERKKKKQ